MGEETLSEGARVWRLMSRISELGERLTFEQAFFLAQQHAEIYRRFKTSGAFIQALEVRVGTKKILGAIQNRPDGLRELMYEYKCAAPEDTVLQIWRSADKQFDAVPLLFQELRDVTAEGISRTEHFPNGQSITLFVVREQDGAFSVKISFAVGIDINHEVVRQRGAAAGSGAATSAITSMTSRRQGRTRGDYPTLWMQPSGFQRFLRPGLATAIAMMLLISSFFGGYAVKAINGEERPMASISLGAPNRVGLCKSVVINPQCNRSAAATAVDDVSPLVSSQVRPSQPIDLGILARITVIARLEAAKGVTVNPLARSDITKAVDHSPQQDAAFQTQMLIKLGTASDDMTTQAANLDYMKKRLKDLESDPRLKQALLAEINKAVERHRTLERQDPIRKVKNIDPEETASKVMRQRARPGQADNGADEVIVQDDSNNQHMQQNGVRQQALEGGQFSAALSEVLLHLGTMMAESFQSPVNDDEQSSYLCNDAEGR